MTSNMYEQLSNVYEYKVSKWLYSREEINKNNILDIISQKINCENVNDMVVLRDIIEKQLCHEQLFLKSLKDNNLAGNLDIESRDRSLKMNTIIGILHYGKKIINDINVISGFFTGNIDYNTNTDKYIDRYFPCFENDENHNNLQKCLSYLYSEMYANGYKKSGDYIFENILSPEGYRTRAYKKRGTIKDEVNYLTSFSTHYEMWQIKTEKGSDLTASLINHLTQTKDPLFPELHVDINVYSFSNGIYIKSHKEDDDTYQPKFYDYTSSDIPIDLVSCKYFENKFDINITETPNFDKIIKYQEWDKEVEAVFRVMHGRTMYQLGDLDEYWQVVPYLIGEAGTGKSTICNVTRQFYNPKDVGIISNNHQQTFGLENLYEKHLVLGPEIKKDWKLDQSEFQCMVSSDTMTINKKHQKSGDDIKWTAPMLLAGNSFPDFVDSSEALTRRVVMFSFDKPINYKDSDPLLEEKLKNEIPQIIHRHNLAYLDWINKYKKHNIWDLLPEYFQKRRKEVSLSTNGLASFIESDEIKLDPSSKIICSRFHQELNAHLRLHGFGSFKFTPANYNSTFQKYGLKIEVIDKQKWIIGVTMND